MHIIEVSSLDAERYYKISDDQLRKIIEMEPTEAGVFIRKNCKTGSISNSVDDVAFSFADNMDQSFDGRKKAPKKDWIEEWNEFCDGVKTTIEVE